MLQELIKSADDANGRRRNRIIGETEIKDFIQLFTELKDNEGVYTIRVYSYQGFVANSYKYRADISYLEASKDNDGNWRYYASTTDAKRSFANGSLITVNGRGYSL